MLKGTTNETGKASGAIQTANPLRFALTHRGKYCVRQEMLKRVVDLRTDQIVGGAGVAALALFSTLELLEVDALTFLRKMTGTGDDGVNEDVRVGMKSKVPRKANAEDPLRLEIDLDVLDVSQAEEDSMYNLRQAHKWEERGQCYHLLCVSTPNKWALRLGILLLSPLIVLWVVVLAIFVIPVAVLFEAKWAVLATPLDWRDLFHMPDFMPEIRVEKNPEPVDKDKVDTSRMILESAAYNWEGYPHNLDFGIYWFSCNNQCSKGPSSRFFDNSKPSVLYLHGWAPESTGRGFRETINWRIFNKEARNINEFKEANCIDLWIKRGYNVGIFYWDQLSDEPLPRVAERKIYNATAGRERMRWAKQQTDGSYLYTNADDLTNRCAADLAADEYIRHFQAFDKTGVLDGKDRSEFPHVQIVGHSLGSQLALEMYRKLLFMPHVYGERIWFPDQITLLDPYIGNGRKPYLPFHGSTVAHRVTETLNLLHELPFDVAIETFSTSLVRAISSSVPRLKSHTVFEKVDFAQVPWYNVGLRHVVAPHIYFCSILEMQHDPNETPRIRMEAHNDHSVVAEKLVKRRSEGPARSQAEHVDAENLRRKSEGPDNSDTTSSTIARI